MACLGLVERSIYQFTNCRNFATHDSLFCACHQTLSSVELKRRWMAAYLRDGTYRYRGEVGAEQVLAPLHAGLFTLTRQDIKKINIDPAIDIYLLLLRDGFCQPEDNIRIFMHVIVFYISLRTLHAETHYLWTITFEVLFNTSVLLYEQCVTAIVAMTNATIPTNVRAHVLHPETQVLLRDILETDIAHEWSWTSPKQRFEDDFIKDPKPAPEMIEFISTIFLPRIKEIYLEEKEVQKMRMDHCKEELMMVCWHPDRVMYYLELGYEIDDI